MKLIARAAIVLFAAFPCVAFCQNDTSFFSRVVVALKTNSDKNPVEKVHLQLDRHHYTPGEDIWFKAYVVTGSKHELSAISGILNVDLINQDGVVKQSVKLPLAGGLTWGDFKLADTTEAGNYEIRAYTNWMRNAGDEYYYHETITIANVYTLNKTNNIGDLKSRLSPTGLKQPATTKFGINTIDVKFFPEGGSLVYGISSKMAFKAVGDDGLGRDFKGTITDDSGQEIVQFTSKHLGMGWFNLRPLAGKQYKASLYFPDGSEKSVDLPAPLNKGYVLQITSDSLHVNVKIDASTDLLKDSANSRIYLVAQSGGTAYYLANSATHGAALTATIPASKFPSGVVQFTLFSSTGEPLNERLVFIQNNDQLNMSLAANKNYFETRDKVKIEMLAKNNLGQPVLGNFSVAVTDVSKDPTDESDVNTLFSNLLLTSEIKGFIEKPNYYFTTINQQTRNDLDVLMLTQGYRRFEWKKILKNDFAPVVYQAENSLQIAGYVKNLNDKPSVNTKISLLNSSDGIFNLDTVTNKQGYFAFKNLQFNEGTNFLIQAKLNKDVKIIIDSLGIAPVKSLYKSMVQSPPADTTLTANLAHRGRVNDGQISAAAFKHNHQLKEVKIWEKKVIKNSTNLNGAGNADQVLQGKSIDTGCPDIANCLTGKLLSVYFYYDQWGVGHPMTSRSGKATEMKIMLDGFLISPELMNTIAPETVESVEILRSAEFTSIYGNDGYSGLILINTKKAGFSEAGSNQNIVNYTPKGYYKGREFYTPKYDKAKIKLPAPDLRSTVYWNPNIPTDKDGKATFEYFSTDAKGVFKVVIEGINSNGNLGRRVFSYKVE